MGRAPPRHPTPATNKITVQKIPYLPQLFTPPVYTGEKNRRPCFSQLIKVKYIIHTLHADVFNIQSMSPTLLTDEQLIWVKLFQLQQPTHRRIELHIYRSICGQMCKTNISKEPTSCSCRRARWLYVVLLGAIFDITQIGHHAPGITEPNNAEKIYD